jgi:molybdopterin converting factor small subunit
MTVTVEFYGIARERAGVESAPAEGRRLSEVLGHLAARFPRLAETCLDDGRLRAGYIANLNGEQFVTDPTTVLAAGDRVLILSADVGG